MITSGGAIRARLPPDNNYSGSEMNECGQRDVRPLMKFAFKWARKSILDGSVVVAAECIVYVWVAWPFDCYSSKRCQHVATAGRKCSITNGPENAMKIIKLFSFFQTRTNISRYFILLTFFFFCIPTSRRQLLRQKLNSTREKCKWNETDEMMKWVSNGNRQAPASGKSAVIVTVAGQIKIRLSITVFNRISAHSVGKNWTDEEKMRRARLVNA